jgi:hypothetical protein
MTDTNPFQDLNTPDTADEVETRHWLAPVLIGACALLIMFAVAGSHGLPIRDPDARFVGSPLGLIAAILSGFLLLDVIPRGIRRARAGELGLGSSLRSVFLERWWGRRGLIVIACILGFYATYLSYRNLKSFVPFVTSGTHDSALFNFDQAMFFGHDPATLLHSVLGTNLAAHILSPVYMAFLTFVPISLGVVLVWSSRVAAGVWYVTTLSLAWMLGALSYYLLPSLGPIYARPELFSNLPVTGVTELRSTLLEHRLEVLAGPSSTDAVGSIAAFASLHIAILTAATLVAQLLGVARWLRIALWCYLGLTMVATIYFGWHYVVDDIAGVAIGVVATYAAASLTGFRRHPFDLLARVTQRNARVTP